MPALPTGTNAFGIPDLHVPSFSMPEFATFTPEGYVTATVPVQPTWTPGPTDTPGPTVTPSCAGKLFNRSNPSGDYSSPWIPNGSQIFRFYNGSINVPSVTMYLGQTRRVTSVVYRVGGASCSPQYFTLTVGSYTSGNIAGGATGGGQTHTVTLPTPQYVSQITFNIVPFGSPSGGNCIEFYSVTVNWCDFPSTPTPVPTWTPFPTATPPATSTPGFGNPNPTSTPQRGIIAGAFGHLADCRVPVYASDAPVAAFDLGYAGTHCYRLFPGINISGGIWDTIFQLPPIDVPIIDFCFTYYQPSLSLLGIYIDLATTITAVIAFFIVRWALFN